ncbi:MAG: ATP-dependent HslUV protease ATP-binding subunit HslU, partial [Spirosomataceae bacterium]
LTEENFYQILKTPRNALTKQYEAMLASEGVKLTFTDDALLALAKIAFEANAEVENIGARRLQTVISHLLNDVLFDIPETITPGSEVNVDKEMVEDRLSGLVKNRDLSQYIL